MQDQSASAASACPVCRAAKITRINTNSLRLSVPTHECRACGAKLTGVLSWSSAAKTVLLGLVLMLIGFVAFEASKQLDALPQGLRFTAFLAFLGAVFGYAVNRVLRAVRYKPWPVKS